MNSDAGKSRGQTPGVTSRREILVLTALILVCSLATTPDLATCDKSNAVHSMRVPEEFTNPVTCFMHGQAYLAETSVGQEVTADERIKIVCVRSTARTTASAGPQIR
jgi:hypothetical protein